MKLAKVKPVVMIHEIYGRVSFDPKDQPSNLPHNRVVVKMLTRLGPGGAKRMTVSVSSLHLP